MSRFVERITQESALLEILTRGSLPFKSIAKALDLPEKQVGVLLNRLKKKDKIAFLQTKEWGLKTREVDNAIGENYSG